MTELVLAKITVNKTYSIYQVEFIVFFEDKSLGHQDQITIEVNLPIEDENAGFKEIEEQAMTKPKRLLRSLLADTQ